MSSIATTPVPQVQQPTRKPGLFRFFCRLHNRGSLKAAILVLLGFLSASCTSGVKEFGEYARAYDLQDVTAQLVLDKVASAERAHWTQLNERGTGTPRFTPDNAAYYVNVGDPPLTDSMRKSLEAVKRYNDALSGLANGESAGALTARLSSIVVNLEGAQSALLSESIKGSHELLAVATSFSSEVGAARSVLKLALTGAAREGFRRNLIRAYPSMKGILLAFRNGSENLYYAVVSVPGGTSREEGLRNRELVASWVLLIDETVQAMEIAVTAAMQKGSAADLAALSEYSVQMRLLAEKVRAERNR